MKGNDGITSFRVIAGMEEGNFVSSSAIGYSVDNIIPSIPTGLYAIFNVDQVELTWDEADDIDFSYYEIYRNNELITTTS